MIITRIVFNGANIDVTFRAVNGEFNFADPLTLCTGAEADDCDAQVADVTGDGVADGGVGNLLEGEEVTFTTPLGNIVTAASGELALVNGLPSDNPAPIIRAYVNWGNYTSLAPTVGANGSLETQANDFGLWELGQTIDVGSDTTIFATGDVSAADGFDACTASP